MTNQEKFVDLMQDIMGVEDKISLDSNVAGYRVLMEKLCKEFTEMLKGGLYIAGNDEFEFCPFCCSGGEGKKFEFVWVGMNPAGNSWPGKFYWEKTTWQDMVDFYVPKKSICRNKKENRTEYRNIYQWLAKDGVWSNYYRTMIRIHFALLESKEYWTWKDLVKTYKDKEKIEDAFLEQLQKHPTLNADLLPLKGNGINLNADILWQHERYQKYLENLLKFIDEKATEDAWIFFFAPTDAVKKLLGYQKAVDINKTFEEKEIGPAKENDKKIAGGKYFYFQNWGERKLILSPFLQPYHDNGNDISMLISEIKDYFKI